MLVDRLQFAFTIMFHYLFPIGTMGLAPFVAAYTWKAARRRDEESAKIAAFWTKIFAINFAVGVVTGIPMEFQFGTNWAAFSRNTGSVIGQPLAMEGMFAFFLESVFLGALLYGRRGLPSTFVAWAGVMVCAGAWLSGFFVVATNAWMQHPVGYRVGADGTILLENIWRVLFSPFSYWQFAHVLSGALLSGGFVVAGVGAYYLLSRRDEAIGRRLVRAGTIVAFAFALIVVFPTGDRNGRDVTQYQPVKLAAEEGLFTTEREAPLAIIGMPDVARKRLIDPIFVPDFLSFLSYGNFKANVKGLDAYARELWPPVELTYYAYHIMVGLGTIFAAAATIAVILLAFGRLWSARWMLWILMLLMPFPFIANEAGWVATEVGRQPWIVYGLMKTAAGGSPTVSSGEAIFTLIGFAGMYFLLGFLFLYLTLREIGLGPSRGEARVSVAAFVTIAFMFAMYVMLDGYDLGVATVGALIARGERDRSAAMASIGPFWNGNEVWLIAAAAALLALFPAAYAAAFSGFYLPFIVVLWLLMLRGIALELREHFPSEVWHQFWDAAFAASSALLIFVFGIALGNLLRGVPVDAAGYFAGTFAFLLNPYALLVGVFALATLAQHGAAFVALRLDGDLGLRAARMLRRLWWVVLPLYLAVTAATFAVHGGVAHWLLAMPLLSLAALGGVWWGARAQRPKRAFAMSLAFVATLLTAAAGTLFPYLLPAFPAGRGGISIFSAAPSAVALTCALTVTLGGIAIVGIYAPIVWRRMGGKLHAE